MATVDDCLDRVWCPGNPDGMLWMGPDFGAKVEAAKVGLIDYLQRQGGGVNCSKYNSFTRANHVLAWHGLNRAISEGLVVIEDIGSGRHVINLVT